jgi:hypothetical protein
MVGLLANHRLSLDDTLPGTMDTYGTVLRRIARDVGKGENVYSQRAVISERLGPETTLASSYMGV